MSYDGFKFIGGEENPLTGIYIIHNGKIYDTGLRSKYVGIKQIIIHFWKDKVIIEDQGGFGSCIRAFYPKDYRCIRGKILKQIAK